MDFAHRDAPELEGALRVARELATTGAAGPEHLWAGVLHTAYGARLLEAFCLTLGQVTEKLGSGQGSGEWTEEAELALREASQALAQTLTLESLELDLTVEPCHLAYALVHKTPKPIELIMASLGVVPSRLRWIVAGSDPRFPHPRDVGENRRMSWAAAASEEARRLGWSVVGPDLLLLGLLADPTNSACRALKAAGVDLRELRVRLEEPGPGGGSVEEMAFSPEVLEALKRAAESWGDLDPDSGYTLQALLAVADLLGDQQKAVEAALPRVLHGSLERDRAVTIEGVGVGMSAAEVLSLLGEPLQRTREEGQESWAYGDTGVMVKAGRVVGVHGPVLEQQGQEVLLRGDPWLKAEEVLGVRRMVSFVGDPPVKIWTLITSGTVGFLMLECLSHA